MRYVCLISCLTTLFVYLTLPTTLLQSPLHRDAYQKVNALCLNPNTSDLQWMQLVENTNWPSMIRLILSAAWQTAFHVHYNRFPVLVHCSVSTLYYFVTCCLDWLILIFAFPFTPLTNKARMGSYKSSSCPCSVTIRSLLQNTRRV